MENEWIEFNLGYTTLNETIEIIDDVLCYLFEFKVENHRLYFREIA